MRMTHDHLDAAVKHFGLTPTGPARLGLEDASITTTAVNDGGERVWVKVAPIPSPAYWPRPQAHREAYDALAGRVPMPRLCDEAAWPEPGEDEEGYRRWVRVEVYEYLRAPVVSATPELHEAPGLSEEWWLQLRAATEEIAATQEVGAGRPDRMIRHWIREVGGRCPHHITWEPCHGDLHWANLHAGPDLVITDWSGWGLAPRGLDAATLLVYSLPDPATVAWVRRVFGDVLESEDGWLAQVYAAAEVLTAVDAGFHPQLEQPIRGLLAELGIRG